MRGMTTGRILMKGQKREVLRLQEKERRAFELPADETWPLPADR
jgi:hypothetical protein